MKTLLPYIFFASAALCFATNAAEGQQKNKDPQEKSTFSKLLKKIKSQRQVSGGVVLRDPDYAIRLDDARDFVFLHGTTSVRLYWRANPLVQSWRLDFAGKSFLLQANFADIELPRTANGEFLVWSLTPVEQEAANTVKAFHGVASVSQLLAPRESDELLRLINSSQFHSERFSYEKSTFCEWFRLENHIEWNQHCK